MESHNPNASQGVPLLRAALRTVQVKPRTMSRAVECLCSHIDHFHDTLQQTVCCGTGRPAKPERRRIEAGSSGTHGGREK
jgi:hypothetical protein